MRFSCAIKVTLNLRVRIFRGSSRKIHLQSFRFTSVLITLSYFAASMSTPLSGSIVFCYSPSGARKGPESIDGAGRNLRKLPWNVRKRISRKHYAGSKPNYTYLFCYLFPSQSFVSNRSFMAWWPTKTVSKPGCVNCFPRFRVVLARDTLYFVYIYSFRSRECQYYACICYSMIS